MPTPGVIQECSDVVGCVPTATATETATPTVTVTATPTVTVTATPASGQWVWARQDPLVDLPSEDHRDLLVNKARPVTLKNVCCNGFVSEWLTYQALLLGFHAPSITSKIISPLGGAALALTGALAAACFVKAFGISFLGRPRSLHAQQAKESSSSMIAGMAILTVLCLAAGVFPGTVLSVISPAGTTLAGSDGNISYNGFLSISRSLSSLDPAAILLSMLCIGAAVIVIIIAGGKRKTVYADSWDCGMPFHTARMQYTATSFTKPIRLIFKRIYLPKRDLSISYTRTIFSTPAGRS